MRLYALKILTDVSISPNESISNRKDKTLRLFASRLMQMKGRGTTDDW